MKAIATIILLGNATVSMNVSDNIFLIVPSLPKFNNGNTMHISIIHLLAFSVVMFLL